MIKALEIKTLIAFNLVFLNNAILSCFFFFFFLIIDLYFLISVVVAQIFNPTAELVVVPTGMPANAANEEIETKPETAEIKISSVQHNLKTCKSFRTSYYEFIMFCFF